MAQKFTTIGPIVVDSVAITSSDQEPNPGDYLKFVFRLHNQGSQAAATNITAKILPLDTCASLKTTIVANFGDIAAGESVLGDKSQYIKFSDNCTDGYQTQFAMEIYGDGYHFWSDTFTIDVVSGIEDQSQEIVTEFKLNQNYPNPFNPITTIKYALPKTEFVTIEIYNTLGQKLATVLNKRMPAGYHEVKFNGQNLASGIYLYKIEAGTWQEVKKMVLIK